VQWTLTNFIIQVITGVLGGHAAAIAAKEHSFGAVGHTLTGLIGGALSGFFLQTLASTVVTGAGDLNEPRMAEVVVLQGLTGAIAGAIATLATGFTKHALGHDKSGKG
jgi:uncharacterized membrane protein YeaQ/YmgE (transglycosylase-associated protein family)